MQILRNIRVEVVCRARIEYVSCAEFNEWYSAQGPYGKNSEPGSPCSIGDGTVVEQTRRMDALAAHAL